MSRAADADDLDDLGPAQARVTPPLDALATVTLDGTPITTLSVSASSTLRVHLDDRDDGGALDDYDDLDDVPEPANADEVPDDAQAEVPVPSSAWVTITVDGVKRTRVSASSDTLARVHLEPDRSDEVSGA